MAISLSYYPGSTTNDVASVLQRELDRHPPLKDGQVTVYTTFKRGHRWNPFGPRHCGQRMEQFVCLQLASNGPLLDHVSKSKLWVCPTCGVTGEVIAAYL